mmetsp:Transcript_17026/g.30757  ORF Transcript_17026/g.30757 Transcript_17026/m.30757 type:complete len:179 (+) Transcript_17026:90-626(+)
MLSGDAAIRCLTPEVEASLSRLQYFACSMVWLLIDCIFARTVPKRKAEIPLVRAEARDIDSAWKESLVDGELHCALLCVLVASTILVAGLPHRASIFIFMWAVSASIILICWELRLVASLLPYPTIFGANQIICFMLAVWTGAVALDVWYQLITVRGQTRKNVSVLGRTLAAHPLLPS